MQITCNNLGKRYNREWIFRHFNFEFSLANKYAITGANGSGKSTLLQVIAGAILHTEGNVVFNNNKNIEPDKIYSQLAFASPYLELIEEMTAIEFLHFHASFKPLNLSIDSVLEQVSLQSAAHKQIRYFSSGMKQRLKLAQAFFSNTPILLLDEPTSNLDAEGIALYHRLINNIAKERLVIISSNDKQEYACCNEIISVADYK
ncbi:MAG: ABC transporter ATP-binding protein [Bacteroidetes bacterium]|nr:ABC transporter ATP-binding protein [Bacteroidota bacterium]MBS1756951.1 ABC transporter ATP-binding protein [Bacteroidota bacterium]